MNVATDCSPWPVELLLCEYLKYSSKPDTHKASHMM